MARDYLDIGSVPYNETCEQVGTPNYDHIHAHQECLAFKEAIRKKLGDEPEHAMLSVKASPHDFGTYHEVVCYYDDQDEIAMEYAYRCEGEAPATWAEVGMEKP